MEYSKKRIIKRTIPDNDKNGMNDTIKFLRDLTVKDLSLSVNVKHPYSGDISLALTGPNGKTVQVLGSGRGPGKDVKEKFSGEMFKDFIGIKSKGDWVLKVADNASRDNGTLVDWTLDWSLANAKKSEVFIQDKKDLTSAQYCHQFGAIASMTVEVNVEHGHIGDLVMVLTSPSGKSITLHDRIGGTGKSINKTYSAQDLQGMNGEKAKGKWTMKISDTMPRDSGRIVSWKLNIKTAAKEIAPIVKAAPVSTKDDLKKIEGIGPKIEGLLNAEGINTWRQLANTEVSRIKRILDAAGPRYQMHDPTSWPRQSKMAADGEWDKLQKLQDELDGGR